MRSRGPLRHAGMRCSTARPTTAHDGGMDLATNTRERILVAAEELLRRHGPAKTTVADVARSLGMSHANVYRHFASKADLRDAVAERWLTAITTPLEAIVAEPSPPRAGWSHGFWRWPSPSGARCTTTPSCSPTTMRWRIRSVAWWGRIWRPYGPRRRGSWRTAWRAASSLRRCGKRRRGDPRRELALSPSAPCPRERRP